MKNQLTWIVSVLIFFYSFSVTSGNPAQHRQKIKNTDSNEHERKHHQAYAEHHKDKMPNTHSGHDKHNNAREHSEHDEHHDHGHARAIGPNKAITVVDDHQGFKISTHARKTLALKSQSVRTQSFQVPQSALVFVKGDIGVYRIRNDYYKLITPHKITRKGDQIVVHSEEFTAGDEVVTDGLGLLRMTDIYSTDESEYGHAH